MGNDNSKKMSQDASMDDTKGSPKDITPSVDCSFLITNIIVYTSMQKEEDFQIIEKDISELFESCQLPL